MEDMKKELAKLNVNWSGLNFTNALFLVFLVLKLTHVIEWSWWWVTAPLWGPLALIAAIAVLVFGGALVCAVIGALFNRGGKEE